MMECNKEEAVKAMELAEKRFYQNDIDGAWRMALKAHSIFPGLDGIAQMVASLRVLVAGKVTIGQEKDWYVVLSVDPSSDVDVVKKQYRRLALTLHPDKNKSVGADAAFKLVSEACNVLTDKKRREAFDYKRKLWASPKRKDAKLYSRSSASLDDSRKGALSDRKTKKNACTSAAHVDNSTDASPTVWFTCVGCMIKCEYFRVDVNQSLRCPRCFKPFLAAESGTFGERAPPSDSIATQQEHELQKEEDAKKDSNSVTSSRTEDPSSFPGVECTPFTDSLMKTRQGSLVNAKSQGDPYKIVGAGLCSSSDCPPIEKRKTEREKVRGESQNQSEKTVGRDTTVSDKPAGGTSMTVGADPPNQISAPRPDKQTTVTNKTKGCVLKDVTTGQDQQPAADGKMNRSDGSYNRSSDHNNKSEDIIIAEEASPSNSTSDGTALGQEQQPASYEMKTSDETNRSSSDHTNKCENIINAEAPSSNLKSDGTARNHDQQPAAEGKMRSSDQSNKSSSDHTNTSDIVIVEETPPCSSSCDGTAPGQDQQPAADDKMKTSDEINRSSSDHTNKSEDIVNAEGTTPSCPGGFCDLRKKKKYRLLSRLLELTATAADTAEMLVANNELKKESSKIGGIATSLSNCSSNTEADLSRRTRCSILVRIGSKQKPTPEFKSNGSKGGGGTRVPTNGSKGGGGTRVPTPIPDSDFYDFDRDRAETSFTEGQIWAVYDDEDGMPRLYVLIQEVLSSAPFKIRMAFLTSRPTSSEFGAAVNWAQTQFTNGCGDFQTELYELREDCLTMFSHQTYWKKLPGRGSRGFRIVPCKGDVWVLYKNWSPDWGHCRKRQDVACEYEVVQVMEEYSKERGGVMVVPLLKVRGYTAVFRRYKEQEHLRLVPREEMLRFSHRVPAKLLTPKDGEVVLEGCVELDPAAVPLDLLYEEGDSPAGKSTGSKQGNAGTVSCSLPCNSNLYGQNKRRRRVPTGCK